MADGAPTRSYVVTLDDAMASQLEETARVAGFDTETFLFDMVATTLVNYEVGDSATESARRFQHEQAGIALADYDRTGVSYPLEDVLKEFRADVEARLAKASL